jgi:hypothetical protein
MPNLTYNSVQAMIAEQTKTLLDQVAALRSEVALAAQVADDNKAMKEEVASLRDEVAQLRAALASSNEQPTLANAPNVASPAAPFADVVKASVQTVLDEEKTRNEVVIHNMKDENNDADSVNSLCADVNFTTLPTHVSRLGKVSVSRQRPRPIKATFPSSFDARAFQARVSEAKKDGALANTKIRCRPALTKDEQTKRSKVAQAAYNLNTKAKQNNAEESFSLRPVGQSWQIWKFVKNPDGRWKRDTDWIYKSPDGPDSGNDSQPSSPTNSRQD